MVTAAAATTHLATAFATVLLGLYFSRESPQPRFTNAAWRVFAASEIAAMFGATALDWFLMGITVALVIWMYILRAKHFAKR